MSVARRAGTRTPGADAAGLTRPARDLATPAQLSELLNVPTATLTRWRYESSGPPFYRLGRGVRYSLAEVGEWLAANRVAS